MIHIGQGDNHEGGLDTVGVVDDAFGEVDDPVHGVDDEFGGLPPACDASEDAVNLEGAAVEGEGEVERVEFLLLRAEGQPEADRRLFLDF